MVFSSSVTHKIYCTHEVSKQPISTYINPNASISLLVSYEAHLLVGPLVSPPTYNSVCEPINKPISEVAHVPILELVYETVGEPINKSTDKSTDILISQFTRNPLNRL